MVKLCSIYENISYCDNRTNQLNLTHSHFKKLRKFSTPNTWVRIFPCEEKLNNSKHKIFINSLKPKTQKLIISIKFVFKSEL